MTPAVKTITTGRISAAFERARSEGRAALVLYIMAGDPDLARTEALVRLFDELRVDVVELGLPFSDPIADGPVIQAAAQRALCDPDISLRKILDFVGRLRDEVTIPIVGMGYTNPIMALGYETFAKLAAERGLDGVIIPDLPPEEGRELLTHCDRHGLAWIQLAAPTTPPQRLRLLAQTSRGFLYYVSRLGITGEQQALSATLAQEVAAVRAASPLPVAVGFGISTPEQTAVVAGHADGVVIGSALVRVVGDAPDTATCVERVRAMIAPIQAALAHGTPDTECASQTNSRER